VEEQILEILDRLADTCKDFAENVNRELSNLGSTLSFSYDAQFEIIQKEIRKLQKTYIIDLSQQNSKA